jgi:hypothetical protein
MIKSPLVLYAGGIIKELQSGDSLLGAIGGQSSLVAQQTVSGAAVSSITFSGLDGLADGGYVMDVAIYPGVQGMAIGLQINGDSTAANYIEEGVVGSGAVSNNALASAAVPSNYILAGYGTGLLITARIDVVIAGGQVVFTSIWRSNWASVEYIAMSGSRYTQTGIALTSLVLQGYSNATNNTLANCFGVGSVIRLFRKIVGGSAHTIQAAGTNMPAESRLNFSSAFALANDPTNGATLVDTLIGSIKSLTTITGSLTNGQSQSYDFGIARTFVVTSVIANQACRIRLYSTAAARTADASRPVTTRPIAGTQHGVIVDIVLTGAMTWNLSPLAPGANGDSPTASVCYATITNLSGSTTTITITVTSKILEL